MGNLVHRRFRFPESCNIAELVMRETTGIDEKEAATAADAAQGQSSLYQELIKLSVVSVDGTKIIQPFNDMLEWNSKTRALCIKAFEQLNELKDEEVATFLTASEDATPGLASVPEGVAEPTDGKEVSATTVE